MDFLSSFACATYVTLPQERRGTYHDKVYAKALAGLGSKGSEGSHIAPPKRHEISKSKTYGAQKSTRNPKSKNLFFVLVQ